MHIASSILIVTTDTVAGLGLRTLFTERFGLRAAYIPSWADVSLPVVRRKEFLLAICDEDALNAVPPALSRALRNKTAVYGRGARRLPFLPYVDISQSFEDLQQAIDAILPAQREDEAAQEGILSAREIEVLTLLARGHINKEIAAKLSISVHTVISHRNNISAKLGIRTVPGLTVYATINGYISPDAIL